MSELDVSQSLARFGPTRGDRVRLADTDLWVRVPDDRQAVGDEPILGYAKNLRGRMTQEGKSSDSELDVIIAGALVIDPIVGILKADIGIKDGRVVGVGRAGNRDLTAGVDLPIGPHTRPIMGYGLIATPGAIDSHVHLVSPHLLEAALSAGVTTIITGGFEEPPWAMERTFEALEAWPLNIGMQACARTDDIASLDALLDAGAIGLKIHEDYGAYPELIDSVLTFADMRDIAVALHTDGLHEAAELEDTVAAIAGRTVHAYHVEGTGGGHVPDLLGLVREPNIICSSTTPTVPFGVAAPQEHVAMTLLVHLGSWGVPHDVALVSERVHPHTMAAEGPLHELGAIAIVNSDSQGMGRIMETVRRTVQLAHVMKAWRRTEAGSGHPGLPPDMADPASDNDRVLRYLAKVTIEPATVHGIADHVGSLAPGRLADIVLWRPAFFGVKPEMVLKSGYPAWGPLGDGNATVARSEPTRYGPDWGGSGSAARMLGSTFLPRQVMADRRLLGRRSTKRTLLEAHECRHLDRSSLSLNRATVPITIDPLDGHVRLEGRTLAVEPAADLPLSRRYFLR